MIMNYITQETDEQIMMYTFSGTVLSSSFFQCDLGTYFYIFYTNIMLHLFVSIK